VPAVGLAVFRVLFCSILMLEVGQLFVFRHLIFDDVPFVEPGPGVGAWRLAIWMLVIALLVVGLWTRVAAVANYLLAISTLSPLTLFEYHHDYVIVGVSFLLIFLPVSRALSVDRWRARHGRAPERPTSVPLAAYDVPIFVILGLVYFDSAPQKLSSPMWRAGLGFWQPVSAPYNTMVDASWLLDQYWIVVGLSHITLLFELLFLVLVWSPRPRVPLLVVGAGLHLSILVFLALPLFALGMASVYALLVPAEWWRRLGCPSAWPWPSFSASACSAS
jgi:hypothetical protein